MRCLVRYNSRGDQGFLGELSGALRREIEIVAGDVCDAEAMQALVRGRDAVLHLAALIGIPYSYEAPSSYVNVNVHGTLNLLNAVRRAECQRFIHTSTSEVYGTAQYIPIDEQHPLVGQSPYAASKIAADKLAESFARSFGTPVAIIRPFNTFGPRQSLRAVIPTIAAQLLDDSVREVIVGSLTPVRDFTFVTDTARAFLLALEAEHLPFGEAINLGTGSGEPIDVILETLQEITGVRKPVVTQTDRVRPEQSEVQRLVSNNQRAQEVLGWRPQVALRRGLEYVVEYLRSHWGADATLYHV